MQFTGLELNYSAILPELITAIVGVIVMMVDAFSNKGARRANATLSVLGLIAAGAALVYLWRGGGTSRAFSGMVVVDPMRIIFALIILLAAILAVLLATQFLRDENLPPGEFFALLLFSVTGMLFLVAAGDLVMVFLGLEISSISSYVMAGYRKKDVRANESSLKYFLLGSFATAFLLYGMALAYGATGTTSIEGIRLAVIHNSINYPALLLVGAGMMIVGFGFKVAAAPFHLWTPDVYEGAPTIVTAFMATAPKAAVFAAFLRVFAYGFNAPTAGIGLELHTTWANALALIALLTMTIGNVIALSQKNIKRLLAYSSIAHAGYTLVGFLTGNWGPVAFYMLTYTVMNIGAFAVVQLLARAGDRRTEIADYAGIGFEVPALSFPLAIFLLSLAGIPPMAGFIGKFFVFKSAWELAPAMRWLVVAAIINSIISIYYYIYPIVVMFFRPLTQNFVRPRVSGATAAVLLITLAAVFYLGLMPNRVLSTLNQASAPVMARPARVAR
jgi:NADH-quinone oxidoreductase subunit N